ncbi:RDD family protein [Jannaschia donghaensis]|uniref:RDD family protein n=1 Tax=Jannaschia donghaensis TaxID=420998 RepID=A0A0M6YL89_9RHOB|nr:RDD family protein [Jannaschia donghaensis]CTQ50589.1 RDD family protein [Jannaschia donghaensis]
MTYWTDTPQTDTSALPDAMTEPQFYDGILVKRTFAWVVDIAVITALTVAAGITTLTIGFFLWPVFFIVIGALYRISTLSNRSATWGMRLMGIELRGHDGHRFDTGQATLHVLGYYGSMMFILPILASIAAMLVTDRRQTLTDMVLGSAAINRPA